MSNSAGEVKHIAPHDESGFRPVDVLALAEEGDDITLEMKPYGEDYVSAEGEVSSVRTEKEDDRIEVRNVYVHTDDGEMHVLPVKVDLGSAFRLLLDVGFESDGQNEYDYKEIEDFAHCELERAGEADQDE